MVAVKTLDRRTYEYVLVAFDAKDQCSPFAEGMGLGACVGSRIQYGDPSCVRVRGFQDWQMKKMRAALTLGQERNAMKENGIAVLCSKSAGTHH